MALATVLFNNGLQPMDSKVIFCTSINVECGPNPQKRAEHAVVDAFDIACGIHSCSRLFIERGLAFGGDYYVFLGSKNLHL